MTIEFCAAVFKGVLNSFQMASLLVQAYPAVPDALAVASAVIADMNEKCQPLPSGLASLQAQGLAGLSMAAPLLCPASDHNPNAPSTAAAAAAAAAAAGVSQGASIGLGAVGHQQPVPLLQTLQGMGHRDAGVASGVPQVPGVTVGPGAINGSSASTASVAAAAVDSLFGGQMQPGAEQQQQQQAAQ
jgi:hypothetical protein